MSDLPPLPLGLLREPTAPRQPEPDLGFARTFLRSFVQDSFVVRSAEELAQREREFGGFAPPKVEGYNPFADPEAIRGYDPRLFVGSESPAETDFIRRWQDQQRERRRQIDEGPWLASFLAGNLTPESLALLPLGIGPISGATRGAAALSAATRTAGLTGAQAGALALLDQATLPADVAPPLVESVALSALFGAALGGAAGSVLFRSVDQLAQRHASVHDAADGLRTDTPMRSMAPSAPAAAEMTPEAFAAARAEVARLVGPEAKVDAGYFQEPGLRGAALGPVVRLSLDLDAGEVGTVARHEAIHALRELGKITDVEWAVLRDAAQREGWIARSLTREQQDAIYAGLSPERRADVGLEEAVASRFEAWAAGRADAGAASAVFASMRQFLTSLRNGMAGRGFQTADDVFGRIEAGMVGARPAAAAPRGPALADALRSMDRVTRGQALDAADAIEAEVARRAAQREALALRAEDPTFDADPGDAFWRPRDAEVPAAGDDGISIPPRPPGGDATPPRPAQSDPEPDRLAPAAGMERYRWSDHPFYVLANNRFTGAVANMVARLAMELVQTPGLRTRGAVAGTTATEAGSIEARAAAHTWRYVQAVKETERLYYRYRGLKEEDAGAFSVRARELREAIPMLPGGRPAGTMSLAEFDAAVFREIGDPSPHAVPEVREAAAFWTREFFDPLGEQAAATGMLIVHKWRDLAKTALLRQSRALRDNLRELDNLVWDIANATPEQRALIGVGGNDDIRKELHEKARATPAGLRASMLRIELENAIEQIDQRIKLAEEAKPAREQTYAFRNWNRRVVRERRDELVANRIAPEWERESGYTWASPGVRAEVAVGHLLGDGIGSLTERVVRRALIERGFPSDEAARRAAEASADFRSWLAGMDPSRLKVEWASVTGRSLPDPYAAVRVVEDNEPSLLETRLDNVLAKVGITGEMGLRDADGVGEPGADFASRAKLREEILGKDPGAFDQADRYTPAAARERSIDVPTRVIFDFLDPSLRAGAADYARRMGTVIEMDKVFGDPNMMIRMAATEISMLREAWQGRGDLGEIAAVQTATRQLRDKLLGVFMMPEDPDAMSVRAVRLLTNSAVAAQMGSSLIAAVTDAGRMVMAHGLQPVFGAFWQAAVDRAGFRLASEDARLAGAAVELYTLGRARAFHDGQNVGADRSLIERAAQGAADTMMFVNLLGPWTQVAQEVAGSLTASQMVRWGLDARAGRLTDDARQAMLAVGMDEQTATRVASEWEAAGAGRTAGGLYLMNSRAWADQDLAQTVRAALKTAVDSQVVKPGAADRPNFMSMPLMQMLLLYKGFAIGATQRIVMAGLQQRDALVLSGMLSSIAIAWMTAGPAEGAYDKNPILSWERMFTAIEKSGVTGIFADLNNAIESASANALGLRPLLGLDPPLYAKDPTWARMVEPVVGPAISPWLNATWALTSPAATGDQVAGAIRRVIWFNNLLWVDGVTRALSREAGSAIEAAAPSAPGIAPPARRSLAGG